MVGIPGYEILGLFRSTSSTLLYHAVREADGLPVIVKTPASEHPGPRQRARYQREYSLLQRLQGTPGVLRIHGHELIKDRPLLLLDDVGGRPLSDQLEQPMEASRFLEIVLPLVATLAGVHRRGVIHKDIKPANILLSEGGKVWLIDFGLATLQQVEHVESAGLIEGTLAYMSPEQSGRMNRPVDYRTDLYSLGVTLYQMLTGQLPFHGKDALEWFHAHIAQAPLPPHQRLSSVPPLLSAVVLKLLAKSAEERYQSAEGLLADLERCQEALRQGSREAFPLGLRDFPARFQLPQGLYGREPELEALLGAFERVAREGRPEWVLVSGYAGIGKSSVIQELHKPVLQRRGFFLRGKFNPLRGEVPYATLAQAMQALVQQVLAGSDEEVEAWRERLLEAFEGNGQVLVNRVPQLEQVVGKQPPVPELPPAETRNRFHRLFQRFLRVFATSGRPLVFFLDDLQWADFASLKLLQYLTTHPDTPPVLLIGAYRDNEVSASHPLLVALGEVRQAGARLTSLHLGPLLLPQTRRLVADALPGAADALVEPLSALVQEKTGGNPFFLLQFLQALYQDGLVSRLPEGGWQWDAEAVRARGYSDNVVDFLVGRLLQMPVSTRQLLRLAACVGSAFELETLAIISGQEAAEAEQGLERALMEELVAQTGPQRYRFLHDRIQQAAYALIAESDREEVHLEVGRLLWARLPPEELSERLFEVVGHLNAGVELMEDVRERSRLAQLNAEAGFRAKAATAWRSAIRYFSQAFSLLPGDPWALTPGLAFKLRLEQATSELASSNLPEARRLVEELLPRASTRQEMAACYVLKSEIHLSSVEGPAAVACLLQCLERFGVSIPAQPTWEQALAANEEVDALVAGRSIEGLVDQPPLADPDLKTVVELMAALINPAFFSNGKLLALLTCRMVALTVRHGSSAAATLGYAWYGLVASGMFRDSPRGYAFGRLASALVERHGYTACRAKVLFIVGHVSLWARPLHTARQLYRESFHHAVVTGDFLQASYCCNFLATLPLVMGLELSEAYRETVAASEFPRKAGNKSAEDFVRLAQALVQQMRGLNRAFDSLDMEGFSEKELEGRLGNRLPPVLCWYSIAKTRSRFLCGAYEEARLASDKAQELIWTMMGRIQLLDHHLYRALTLAACHPAASAPQQEAYGEEIQRHHQQLEEWSLHAPETFRGPERMVYAELARLRGHSDAAARAYEEAIEASREHGFIQNVALASELAARFWKQRGFPTLAMTYARQAREAYAQWGAEGKVRHLDAQWPHLAVPSASSQDTSSMSSGSSQVDALTVVKAQQAISREMDLETLVGTLMRVVLENAGAQRGALLLLKGDTLEVEAASPAAAPQELPWTLLSYVRRTGEHVLIDDTSKANPFSSDPFFAQSQARCVLGLPLRRQEEFHGLLYLENSLTPEAFSASRITLLQHLASQAVISIENARLYAEVRQAELALRRANEELELRVEERTRELKQAQARLVETARSVGMAEVAANVLHDVGNTLNSLVVDSQQLSHAVEISRVGRVEQVALLLEQHREQLPDFFARDPRGTQLVSYLTGLAGELGRERSLLQQGMTNMCRNIDRVRSIVALQQTYAKSTLLEQECELPEVLEEALRLQLGALTQAEVRVEKELEALPRVTVDRHRLLQILINLLSNARQALEAVEPGRRRVRLRLYRDGEWVCLQVVDNGQGISREARGNLFSQGFTTRKEGHGIGLHSSALSAQLMGGKLTLESEGPGLGATATLRLPFSGATARVLKATG
ncbi:MAG: AAA family ATPase [Myxococcaceae bacterium]|nr:AAA family ATPase [Myxococcaceae bacterium]